MVSRVRANHFGDAERQFAAQGLTKEKQVIAYCGRGISATIDLLLLRLDRCPLWAEGATIGVTRQGAIATFAVATRFVIPAACCAKTLRWCR